MTLDVLATRIADKPETRRLRGQGKFHASLGSQDVQDKALDVEKGQDGFEKHRNPPRKNRKAGNLTAAATCTFLLEQLPETEWRIGKLSVRLREADEARPFTLLDFHDGAIRDSGQILIEAGFNLMLHGKDAITQPARRSGNFVADLMAGPVKSALSDISRLRSLLVVGSGNLRHSQLALVDDEGKTRARADLIRLHPQGSGQKVTLATLHGLRGYDKAFLALSAYLQGASPARDVAALAGMLFPEHEPYDPKPEVRILPDDLAYDAANEIIRIHLAVARRNEAGIIADHDSEFLHDYRVALRKIRSVISLFRGTYGEEQTADLKRRFSDLMDPTGQLRDLDVYLLERDAYFALLPETMHDGLRRL